MNMGKLLQLDQEVHERQFVANPEGLTSISNHAEEMQRSSSRSDDE